MPSETQTSPIPETPGERVLRQYYQAKLGERLGQFAEMAAGRSMMRRGAKKMQDGTLGQATGEPEVEDMNIRVGDEIHHHHTTPQASVSVATTSTEQQTATQTTAAPLAESEPVWKTWAKRAALVAAGAGGIAGYQWWNKPVEEKPPAVETPAVETPADAGAYWKYGVKVRPPGE